MKGQSRARDLKENKNKNKLQNQTQEFKQTHKKRINYALSNSVCKINILKRVLNDNTENASATLAGNRFHTVITRIGKSMCNGRLQAITVTVNKSIYKFRLTIKEPNNFM